MRFGRRAFLSGGVAGLATLLAPRSVLAGLTATVAGPVVKPPHLKPGDTIGLINPVSVPMSPADLRSVTSTLGSLGMQVKCGARLDVAASDEERAAEVNALFEDPSVKAILPVRGGWGSARLLPHLDYRTIRRNPKVLMGFSDVSALLLGVNARAGLVTFHGPMGISSWEPFTVEQMKRILFQREAVKIARPAGSDDDEAEARVRTIVPGRARGCLIGGNLTVLSSIVGSPYLGGRGDLILFLEDVREPYSEVARKLTQLELAGILRRVRGVVFGQCTRCNPPAANERLTLERVLRDQLEPLRIPAWSGALIGHIERQLTLPIGVRVEIDAEEGSIQLLEAAVC
jgi:muramoyltetrapeptide carboxypeptidase